MSLGNLAPPPGIDHHFLPRGQGIRQKIARVAGTRSLKKTFPGVAGGGGCTQLELTETLVFVSYCFQLILDCFVPNFKLMYEDSENIKADSVVLNLNQMSGVFWDTRYLDCAKIWAARDFVTF